MEKERRETEKQKGEVRMRKETNREKVKLFPICIPINLSMSSAFHF